MRSEARITSFLSWKGKENFILIYRMHEFLNILDYCRLCVLANVARWIYNVLLKLHKWEINQIEGYKVNHTLKILTEEHMCARCHLVFGILKPKWKKSCKVGGSKKKKNFPNKIPQIQKKIEQNKFWFEIHVQNNVIQFFEKEDKIWK